MNLWRRLELPAMISVLVAGAWFLLKMCHLSFAFNCIFGVVYLGIVYSYLRLRHQVNIPLLLLGLVFTALQVDALGNYFGRYGHEFGPLQYDEFAHLTIQILLTPIFVWLVQQFLEKSGQRLSPKMTAFFTATIIFSMSAFYEIIELWDEVYLGDHRIWGPHDTGNDLQWDLCGIVLGTMLAQVIWSAAPFGVRRSGAALEYTAIKQ